MITAKSKKVQVNGNDVGNKENHVSQVIRYTNAFDWVV